MRILVAGASGVIGRPLSAALGRAGHHVIGMTRSAASAAALERSGTTAVVCDCLDRGRLVEVTKQVQPDALINQLTSIPHSINPRKVKREFAATNRLRREGTRNLIAAALEAGAGTVVAQSIAFAYAPGASGLRTESDPLFLDAPESYADLIHAVADLEETVLGEPRVTGIVLRYGFFYGPGTVYAPSGSLSEAVRSAPCPLSEAEVGCSRSCMSRMPLPPRFLLWSLDKLASTTSLTTTRLQFESGYPNSQRWLEPNAPEPCPSSSAA